MHRAFELRQRADVDRRLLEVHVLLEALGGDRIPEEIDHGLALRGDFHLHHRVVEQVAPILRRRRAHVVGGAEREELHRHQTRVGVHEHPADVAHVGHVHPVERAVRGVVDRLVEGVRADADRRPSEVELADVHRVEGVVPGVLSLGQDVALRDRIVVQRAVRTVAGAPADRSRA